MSKEANKTLVGAFVLGALLIGLTGLFVLGSGRLFTKMPVFVMHFEGSVNGLSVGAPVVFRGVKVGTVKDIVLRFNAQDLSMAIPVYVELDPRRVTTIGGRKDPRRNLRLLVERGLRAQLQVQSYLTGQLMIGLDFHPETPVKYLAASSQVPEIPTIPSGFQKVEKTLKELPLKELALKLTSAVSGIDRAVNSPEVENALKNVNGTLTALRDLIQNMDAQIQPLAGKVQEMVGEYENLARDAHREVGPVAGELRATLHDTRGLMKRTDKRVAEAEVSLRETSRAVSGALAEFQGAVKNIRGITSQDSAVMHQLRDALKELAAAARSIRIWADYLERHPEALLRGKGGFGRR